MEEWKDINGYEGIYQISSYGRVKSIDRVLSNGKKRKSKFLYIHKINGYPTVSLCKDYKQRNYKIHRLVAQAFIPNPENKPCVDHIDTDRENNVVSNLRWVTYQENTDNPLSSKSQKEAVSNSGCKKVAQYDKSNKLLNIFHSAAQAGKETSTSPSSICNCCKGRIKTANNFIWKYYDKNE